MEVLTVDAADLATKLPWILGIVAIVWLLRRTTRPRTPHDLPLRVAPPLPDETDHLEVEEELEDKTEDEIEEVEAEISEEAEAEEEAEDDDATPPALEPNRRDRDRSCRHPPGVAGSGLREVPRSSNVKRIVRASSEASKPER